MSDADGILRALVASPPKTIADLEKAAGTPIEAAHVTESRLGTLEMPAPLAGAAPVVAVWAKYWWDMFHENPPDDVASLRTRKIDSFSVTPDGSAVSAAHAILREALGPGRELAGGHGTVYGTWIVRAAGGVVIVARYAQLPDFAVTADPALRARVLHELFDGARRANDTAALARLAPLATAGSGVVAKGFDDQGLTFELVPPMAAADFARLAGVVDSSAIGSCYATHQTDWQLHVLEYDADGSATRTLPTLGAWPLRAFFDARPSGGVVASTQPMPLGDLHRLGTADVVRRVRIGTR